MGHYSERVRRDALTGLASLLTSYPGELKRQVPPHATPLAIPVVNLVECAYTGKNKWAASRVATCMHACRRGL